jgi:hypothetical protein
MVPQAFFPYDLITSNNRRVEVKVARVRTNKRKCGDNISCSDGWEFGRNGKQQEDTSCDFVVCLGFLSKDLSDEPRAFVIPCKILHGRAVFKISANPKRKKHPRFWEYENQWELIVKDEKVA